MDAGSLFCCKRSRIMRCGLKVCFISIYVLRIIHKILHDLNDCGMPASFTIVGLKDDKLGTLGRGGDKASLI